MRDKPRKPWLAGILTIFTIGLGHLYYGDIKKGLILFVGGQLLWILVCSSFLFYAPVGPILFIIIGISYYVYCIVDSVKGAIPYKLSYSMRKYNRWYIYFTYWLVASFAIHKIVGIPVKNNIIQTFKIPSRAMMQTLQIGDKIITDNFNYKISQPKRGDIVGFPFPEDSSKFFIKRVIALGGETLKIIDKRVHINGNILNEPYVILTDPRIFAGVVQPRDNFGPVTVPPDSLFVLGDNRDYSYDSRFWGFVKKSSIKGKAIIIYWSWDKEKFEVRWNRIGKKIQ